MFLTFLFFNLSSVPGRQHCALLTSGSRKLLRASLCSPPRLTISLIHTFNKTCPPSQAQTFHFLVVSWTILEIKITFPGSRGIFSRPAETHFLLHEERWIFYSVSLSNMAGLFFQYTNVWPSLTQQQPQAPWGETEVYQKAQTDSLWVQILLLPLNGCMASDNLFDLSVTLAVNLGSVTRQCSWPGSL